MAELNVTTNDVPAYNPDELDDYNYGYYYENSNGQIKGKPSWMYRLLWWCAGADRQLLKRCPHSDRIKYAGIGGTVLATGMLAALSGGYAFYTVFLPKNGLALQNPQQVLDIQTLVVSLIFAFFWALVIFNLDRFVVSTGKGDGKESISWDEWRQALPRIILAAIIGFTLSKPLEIRIMKSEIDVKLQEMQSDKKREWDSKSQADYEREKTRLTELTSAAEVKIKEVQEKDAQFLKVVNEQRNSVDAEMTAVGGSGKRGDGPIAAQLRNSLKQKTEDYKEFHDRAVATEKKYKDEIERNALAEKEAHEEFIAAQKTNEMKARNIDGLIARIKLAEEVSVIASWTITALLMFIEIAPILFKMMLTHGAYEALLENQIRLVKARYAIRDSLNVKGSDAAVAESSQEFLRSQTMFDYQDGLLKVERSLSRAAQDSFEKEIKSDMEKNPLKYVKTT